jgi:hypothetical protein
MSRPAERVVAFYNKRGTAEQWIKEGKGSIKWTRLSCRMFATNAVRLQLHALALISEIPAHAGDAGTDQGLVAVEPEGETDQDRGQGHQPWPQYCLPDGRGRHSQASDPGDFAADCRAAAEAAARTTMRLPMIMRSTTPDGRPTLRCRGKTDSSDPLPPVGTEWLATRHRPGRALRKVWKIATICLKFQVHPGNPG